MIKDFILIDNNFFLEFWVKNIYIINYLQNRLFTKTQKRKKILNRYKQKKQNMSQLKIFKNIANILILKK